MEPKLIYHQDALNKSSFLVTGGAGFIGSNIVGYLLRNGAKKVRVLDNLSNGYWENIKEFNGLPEFEFQEGDIRDFSVCKAALADMDYVSHQAALGSVPRSIEDPITTNSVNINGFLNVLVAAKESTCLKKMVYAASSSTYGDSNILPKVEGQEGQPLSPYAITKAVNEDYARVFSSVYGFHTIGLRYFNIFGPKQNPLNPYAAVIPLFCNAFLNDTSPVIFGDGNSSRDFTFVENAIQANMIALLSNASIKQHSVFNVACGEQISLNELVEALRNVSGKKIAAIYSEERLGDVKHSKASIDKIKMTLGYEPRVKFDVGISEVYKWYSLTR